VDFVRKKRVAHINIWFIGCCGELKLTRAHGGLIRKDVGMCQKEQCTQLTRWLPLESAAWAEISCFGGCLVKMASFDVNWVLWRAQADSGARRVDQKGRGLFAIIHGIIHVFCP